MSSHKTASMPANESNPASADVYTFWKNFDLSSLRDKLDEQGNEIAAAQEASAASRKTLAERTKTFRKSLQPEVFKQLAPLLKAYQEEVDALTSRARSGEKAFLGLFEALYGAPDPSSVLAENLRLASRVSELETQAAKFAAELAEYEAESKLLKNQDGTIRRLEEKVRSLESEITAKDMEIEAARDEVAAQLQSRFLEEAREREMRLEAELQRADAALEAVRRMHQATQSQLLSVQERGEDAAAAARAEADFAAAEVERAQEQLALLARERDELLKQIRQQGYGGMDSDGDTWSGEEEGDGTGNGSKDGEEHESSVTFEQQTETGSGTNLHQRKESRKLKSSRRRASTSDVANHLTALREELRAQRELAARTETELKGALKKAESELAAAVARLDGAHAQLHASQSRIAALEAEISSRPTREELEDARERIRVLSAVFYNAVGDEYDAGQHLGGKEENNGLSKAKDQTNGENASENKIQESDSDRSLASSALESALLAKNRHLEHSLTMARLEAAETRSSAESLAAQIGELESELEKQRALVAKLEEDLIIAEQAAGLGSGDVNKASGRSSARETDLGIKEGDSSGAHQRDPSVDATMDTKKSENAMKTHKRTNTMTSEGVGEASLLSILTGQRDRLRSRVHELETEIASTSQTLAQTRKEAESTRADNLALMERLRYVQGYAASSSREVGLRSLDVEAGATAVHRWSKEYEEKVVNPLNDFRRREREARQRAMPLQDRAAVAVGSALVSGGRLTKSMIMVYAVALHLMAFIVLAGFSHRHVDRLDQLEELCAGLHPLSGNLSEQNVAVSSSLDGAGALP